MAFIPPLLRLDYIWHTPDLRASQAWLGDPFGSDHRPVVAILRW